MRLIVSIGDFFLLNNVVQYMIIGSLNFDKLTKKVIG